MTSKFEIINTKTILKELDTCIVEKNPFSILRFGDATLGIIASFLCDDLIPVGKWSGRKGQTMSNSILGQLTIPPVDRERLVKRIVMAANRANYIDSFDAYHLLNTNKNVGLLARNWKEIHKCVGILNENYCSCFVHYFSIVSGEFNLFDLMKNRKVFCICNNREILGKLKRMSGAKTIDSYQIPKRGRKTGHYKEHFKEVMKTIKINATKYDLFLIGAGFLGKIYCDEVKLSGGRAFDAGRLFDFWSGVREIDSRPKRFLSYNGNKMLCDRIRHVEKTGVW